jgi:hypothetical protein
LVIVIVAALLIDDGLSVLGGILIAIAAALVVSAMPGGPGSPRRPSAGGRPKPYSRRRFRRR